MAANSEVGQIPSPTASGEQPQTESANGVSTGRERSHPIAAGELIRCIRPYVTLLGSVAGNIVSAPVRQVPLLDLQPQNDPLREEILAAITRVVDSQRYILGPDVPAFEAELAALFGLSHVVSCSSGSDALLLALMAAGVQQGDEVAVPAFSFFATAGAVSLANARPVFCDIDPRTFNMDPAHLEELGRSHPRLKAVIPVHLFGGTADMDPILQIAAGHGWTVIDDAAQSIGASYKNRNCLNLGQMSTLSFFPTKNLGAMGDAGAVATSSPLLAERLMALRVHGSRQKYQHEWIGVNGRMDSMQAAILRVKLPHLADWAAGRTRNANLYLTGFQKARVPVQPPLLQDYQTAHVWNQFVIRAPRRDELREYLSRHGVGTEIYYPTPLHLQPCFAHLGCGEGMLPESEKACREVLALPIHPGLHTDDIDYVVQCIRRFYES